jgi:hypothetical protein
LSANILPWRGKSSGVKLSKIIRKSLLWCNAIWTTGLVNKFVLNYLQNNFKNTYNVAWQCCLKNYWGSRIWRFHLQWWPARPRAVHRENGATADNTSGNEIRPLFTLVKLAPLCINITYTRKYMHAATLRLS